MDERLRNVASSLSINERMDTFFLIYPPGEL